MTKQFQDRSKFFYASPSLFPVWPYASRQAIGMRLSEFRAKSFKTYRFRVNGTMYEIGAERAKELGRKYHLAYGALPDIIPLDEFERIAEQKEERSVPHQLFAV